jgi:hypothetical protein
MCWPIPLWAKRPVSCAPPVSHLFEQNTGHCLWTRISVRIFPIPLTTTDLDAHNSAQDIVRQAARPPYRRSLRSTAIGLLIVTVFY